MAINQIDPNQLLAHMRAAQAQASQTQIAPNANTQGGEHTTVNFSKVIKNAIDNVNKTQKASAQLKTAFEMGDPNVTLAQTMIASQKASVAFEATVQVRNKLVKAYEEVMRMSV